MPEFRTSRQATPACWICARTTVCANSDMKFPVSEQMSSLDLKQTLKSLDRNQSIEILTDALELRWVFSPSQGPFLQKQL